MEWKRQENGENLLVVFHVGRFQTSFSIYWYVEGTKAWPKLDLVVYLITPKERIHSHVNTITGKTNYYSLYKK